MQDIVKIGPIRGQHDLEPSAAPARPAAGQFAGALKDAIQTVDGLQKQSEAAQAAFARGDQVDLHDVLIKVEEADIAFRAMMQVRTKLIDAYREIMRMGSGG